MPRTFREITTLALSVLALALMSSCQTLDMGMVTGKPSFDPATYGTQALKDVIRNPSVSKRDGVAAAQALANRTLSEDDGVELFGLVKLNRHSDINVTLLKVILKQDMVYLTQPLLTYQPKIMDPETAAQSAAVICEFVGDDDDVLFTFMSGLLLNSPHPNVRARAARLLISFGEDAEDIFIKALDKEKSASAATAMCKALDEFGSDKCFPILQRIANDVNRVFVSDKYLGTTVTAETVRATAVATVEAIKADNAY